MLGLHGVMVVLEFGVDVGAYFDGQFDRGVSISCFHFEF